MEQPLISVIVPVYKVEAYLEKCVDSILSQTYENLEVLLVDDGSPDNCGAICDAYAEKDSRVRVIHKPNGGLSSARNAGLDVCRGDYITFVDSDDYLAPGACRDMLAALLAGGADMCVADLWSVDENGTLTAEPDSDKQKEEVIGREEAFRRMTEAQDIYFTILCAKLYRRELFEGLRLPEGQIHEDTFTIHRLCGRCRRIATIKTRVYFYFTRSGSTMTRPYHIKRMEDSAAAYWDRYLYLKEQGYPRYARYALQYCCGTVNVGLQKLPLKGNEEAFYPYIKRVLRYYHGLRVFKMLLLVVKNRLTRWES